MHININENLPEIYCNSQQIQQVILNLLINAKDSLNDKFDKGEHKYNEDKNLIISCVEIYNKRPIVRIIIEDNGTGIPKKIQEKIFEPFFSTKPKDKGTGLGLSISYGIISDHGGNLHFETEENKYTKFYIDLPVHTS